MYFTEASISPNSKTNSYHPRGIKKQKSNQTPNNPPNTPTRRDQSLSNAQDKAATIHGQGVNLSLFWENSFPKAPFLLKDDHF